MSEGRTTATFREKFNDRILNKKLDINKFLLRNLKKGIYTVGMVEYDHREVRQPDYQRQKYAPSLMWEAKTNDWPVTKGAAIFDENDEPIIIYSYGAPFRLTQGETFTLDFNPNLKLITVI